MAQHYSSDDEEDCGGVFQFLVGDLVEDAAQPQLGKGVITVPPPTSNYEQYGYQMQDKPYGAAEVRWFKQEYQRGSHRYVDPLSVLLLDRPLKLRTKVTRWAEKAGPTGKVVAAKKTVNLELEGGQVITNLDSKKLGRVQRFLYGDYVVLGSWLGVVQSVEGVAVTIELPESGEKYVVSEKQVFRSLVPEQQQSVYSQTPTAYLHPKFYPGQKVNCAASTIRKDMPWLKSKGFESVRVEAVVVEVSVTALRVQWLATRTPGDKHVPESYLRDPELTDLLVLVDIHHLVHQHALHTGGTTAELGSKWLIELDPDMMQLEGTMEESSAEEIPNALVTNVVTAAESSAAQGLPSNLKAATVISSKTIVDVLWQDGTLSVGVDAGDLTYANYSSPGYQHDEIAQAIWPHQFVLQKLDRHGEDPDDDVEEEEYADEEEAMRPQQGKGSGRLAFVHSVDVNESTAVVSWFVAGLGRWLPEVPASLYELDPTTAHELQGQYDYGDIVVRPAPATSSPRKRKQLRESASANHKKSRKPASLGGAQSEMDVKPEESGGSWLGVIVGYQAGGCLEVAWGDGSRSTVKHTEVETFREHQFHPGYNYMQPIDEDDDEEPESEEEEEFVLVEEDDHKENGEQAVLQVFKPFDTLKDVGMDEESHSFIQCAASNDAKWIKKVQKELNILKKKIPESIYVRAYEDRKDLLRAVIVGKPGTPYHDGLFAFDFHLPASFPYGRPSFVLLNANRQLNDEASQVINQMWNPRKSTLLEALQTIEDVVLTARPHTKEAGHNTRGKKKVSASEQAQANRLKLEKSFMLHCNCILKTLKTPPQHFEKLVRHHFEKQGPVFLEACQAYLKGAPIGQPDKMQEASDTTSTKGFRLMLKKIIPRIQAELAAAGLEESLDAVGLV